MAGAPAVPRARRAYAFTAPPSLDGNKALTLKRDAPTIWELQTSMAAREQVEAQRPHAIRLPAPPHMWGRAHSTAVTSAVLAESEGNVGVDGDGESKGGGISSSWPRVRKQRTGVRNSMSLWEALDSNVPQHLTVLPSPDTLDARTLADLGDDLSFVDNMFFSHAPAPTPVLAPEDSMGMAQLGALMIAPAAPADSGRAMGVGCRVWCWTAPPAEQPLLNPRALPPCAAGVDLSRIRCSPKTNGQGPSELSHHAPWPLPLPEDVVLLLLHGSMAKRANTPPCLVRPLRLLRAPGGSARQLDTPGRRGWVPERPATASGARASCLQNALALSSSPCGHPPLQGPAHLLGAAQAPRRLDGLYSATRSHSPIPPPSTLQAGRHDIRL